MNHKMARWRLPYVRNPVGKFSGSASNHWPVAMPGRPEASCLPLQSNSWACRSKLSLTPAADVLHGALQAIAHQRRAKDQLGSSGTRSAFANTRA